MIHFAVTDRAPQPTLPAGQRRVRYFAVHPDARYSDVCAALSLKLGEPCKLVFLEPHQVPTGRLETIDV